MIKFPDVRGLNLPVIVKEFIIPSNKFYSDSGSPPLKSVPRFAIKNKRGGTNANEENRFKH